MELYNDCCYIVLADLTIGFEEIHYTTMESLAEQPLEIFIEPHSDAVRGADVMLKFSTQQDGSASKPV